MCISHIITLIYHYVKMILIKACGEKDNNNQSKTTAGPMKLLDDKLHLKIDSLEKIYRIFSSMSQMYKHLYFCKLQ